MFVKLSVYLLVVLIVSLNECVEDDWGIYESKFKHSNREEIFIANVTTDLEFRSNFSVEKWKTINVGPICYTGGITNSAMLAILFSTTSRTGAGMKIVQKVFDLEEPVSDVEFFEERRNGSQTILVIAYSSQRKKFIWYSIVEYQLKKIWTWPVEKSVLHFNTFKMNRMNFLMAGMTNNNGLNSMDIYGFNIATLDHWFYQSIQLPHPSSSSCLTNGDTDFYLSITQPLSDQLLIYQYFEKHFIPFNALAIPQINQVVCFENGFKSFIAFNGINAGIYEFTIQGLIKSEIHNSNLEGIQFWLPIPFNTYRDETILLTQRKLDHGTHFSFDIDVVTYNGKRFEEHVDVPCSLFGEQQNGLKCLAEFNSNTGMLGCSYISILNHLALIVPKLNDTSTLFNLEIGLKKMDHPAKKEIDYLLDLKKSLQSMIDEQKNFSQLLKKRNKLTRIIPETTPDLSPAAAIVRSQSNHEANSKFLKLKNEIVNVIIEVEEINKKIEDIKKYVHGGKFETITFNGIVKIENNITTKSLNTEDREILDLLNDIVRKDQLKPIQARKTFNDLSVSEASFENVNGISSSDFLTNNLETLEVNGGLSFENLVDVQSIDLTTGTINDVEITQWFNVDNLVEGTLSFEQLVARTNLEAKLLNNKKTAINSTNLSQSASGLYNNQEKLFIPGNVTVQKLNGLDFELFLRKLCLTNIKCHIPSLEISGVMNIVGSAYMEYLNGLKFPEVYVGLEPKEMLVITGSKTFKNVTRGNKVTTNNKINNVDLSKIVNLSGEQHVTGTLTFDNLETISGFNVDGKIKGIENVLPNIGLKETTSINSNVEFRNLEVLGDVIVINNFNGAGFYEYLDNIVLMNENATITGVKSFPQGFTTLKNLYINSSLINNISLNSIITKDTKQDLQINTILGNTDFDHLYIKGLFDKQNITDLNATLVKSGINQTIGSVLIFDEELYVKTLIVDELNENNKIMGNQINDTLEDADISFNQVNAESVIVEGNIIGNINSVDLEYLEENYLKYIEDQSISKPYFIEEMTSNELKPKYINNLVFDNTFSYKKFRENITDILTYRNATVDTINVEENLNVRSINDKDFHQIFEDHVWTKLHRNSSRLIIDGNVYFKTLEIQKLANVYFDEYISNLIFKNETDIKIQNSIIFENGIRVKKLIETSILNDITLEHILRIVGEQTITGPINIMGDVTIKDDVTVREMINNVEVTYMLDNFDIGEELLKVKGEVLFQKILYIRNLSINGCINGKNFDDLKNKFAYINGDIRLEKDILFNEAVHINGNLEISKDINGMALSDFVRRVVWLTQDAEIQGPIRFTHSVESYKPMTVENIFNTKLLFGKNLEEIVSKGVFVNKGLLQGPFNFENVTIHDDLKIGFINNINMDTIIPLKTFQRIDGLDISEMSVAHDFDVENKINGVNLVVERDRTLLGNLKQYVQSEIVFLNNVLVEDNLMTTAINTKPASKIVTTNTDQNLTAPYNFNSKCFGEGSFLAKGLVNDINLTSWKNNAIPVHSEETQHIIEKWEVMENLNLVGPLNGDGMMNDINITQLVQDIEMRESYLCDIEKGILEDFSNLCKDVSYIYKNAKNQIYKFKHFEEVQTISLPNHINYVKYFAHQGNYYLLVNEEKSCFSDLMILDPNGFSKIKTIHTGGITQVEIIKDVGDNLFLVSRGLDVDNLTCNIRFSTVIWKWTNDDVQVLASIAAQEVLQESKVPLTFYGLKTGVVTEFKIDPSKEDMIMEYRKWNILEDNASFIPHGLRTGPALCTGKDSIFLTREDPIIDEQYGIDTAATIIGKVVKASNIIIPGRSGGDKTVINVGIKGTLRAMLAVSTRKETQVKHRLDIVEIYSNAFTGELFDQILTYRPSGLTSIEFGNGETLLAFMEDKKVLQLYEYKGIEGFKHRSSIKTQANEIILMELPAENQSHQTKVLGMINNNKITLLQAVMAGNKIRKDLQCAT